MRDLGPVGGEVRPGAAGGIERCRLRRRWPDDQPGRALGADFVSRPLLQGDGDGLGGRRCRVGVVVLGLPLGQGELRLLGEVVVHRPRVVTRRRQDALELEHVLPLVAGSQGPEERQHTGLGESVAAVEREHHVAGAGDGAVLGNHGADEALVRRRDVADLLASQRPVQGHRALQRPGLHPGEDDHLARFRLARTPRHAERNAPDHEHHHDDDADDLLVTCHAPPPPGPFTCSLPAPSPRRPADPGSRAGSPPAAG